MAMVTTNIGLNAIANAEAGGFKVDINRFAVTQATGVLPKIDDTALVGEIAYQAEVQSIEVVSGNKVKFTLFIPPRVPAEGFLSLTEVGIYLRTGELFAHGTFKKPFEKTNDFGLRLIVFVVAARLGEVINFTFGTNASLASAASVRTLIDPTESETNAVIVQDAQTNDPNVASMTAGSLAVRYGAGGLNWGFLGYDLSYRGNPIEVLSASKFKLNASRDAGFWLNADEIVIGQIVAGDGAGESRRMQYDKEEGQFDVLEKPFSKLTEQSVIHIWRATKNQLPTRTDKIKPYYVLGHALNTWKREDGNGSVNAKMDLIPVRLSFKGNGTRTEFNLPNSVPELVFSERSNFTVYVAGKYIANDQFSASREKGIALTSLVPEDGAAIEVIYYKKVESSGSSLTFAVAEYIGTGLEWSFSTPIVAQSSDYLMVFVGGHLRPTTDYVVSGTSVTFTQAAPTENVSIVVCANLNELGAGTTIYRVETTLNVNGGVAAAVPLPSTAIEKKNTIVSIDGRRITHDDYDLNAGKLTVKGFFTNATPISILGFANEVDEILIESYSGENSGPQWVDPAGRYIESNRVEAFTASHIGNGAKTVFSMNSQGTAALVFIDGTFQDPAPITIQSTNGTIILPRPLAAGAKMDIISFQAFDDAGRQIKCSRQVFQTQAGKKSYPLTPSPVDVVRHLTLISVGGVYQHFDTYTIGDGTVEFKVEPPVGVNVEAWHFGTMEKEGYSNAISVGSHNLSASKSEYIHEYYDTIPIHDVGDENNTLLFANTVLQYGDQYSTTNTNAYKFIIPDIGHEAGQKASSFVFYTGESKTRLMTRAEMAQRYMTRDEILKLAFGGTYTPPDTGGGGGGGGGEEEPPDSGDGSGGGAKAMFLSASSQVFAVSVDQIGTPSVITFTANPQNITGDVVFQVLAGDAQISSSGNTASLPYAMMQSDFATIRARATEGGVSYFDDITVVKLQDGKDSVTAILSNESHTLQADTAGVVSSYTGAMTNMEIYRGTVRESDEWSYERTNSPGVTSTITRNQVQITGMTVNQGYVDILARRGDFSPIVKRFSLSLSKTGLQGREGLQGAGATYAILTNEAFVFAASPTGVVSDFSQAKTEIKVIQNNVDETAKWVLSRQNSDGVGSSLVGSTVSITSFSSSNDTGSVTITASRTGYPTLSKVFSLSKAKGSSGSGSATEGPRGSMTFYVSGRTSWSDITATSAATYGNGPRLNDTVVQYGTNFSQTRFWNGSAWVILNQVIDGNLLVRGSVGAEHLSANIIKANSALIENGALGTLMLGGNAVTLAQAVRQPYQNQITISYAGPIDPVSNSSDPTANPVLSMIVEVTGTQPAFVWASWSNPGIYEGTAQNYDAFYWGKYWKAFPGWSECVVIFKMVNNLTGAVYKAGFLSSSLGGGYTTTMSTQAIFQGLPKGTYTLSLCMCKALHTPALPSFALRSCSMAFLETKR